MNVSTINLVYSSDVSKLTEINSSFDRGILRVAYHGDNRNGSNISKEAFERSIDTIYNCPVVCNYNRETDSIGAHDIEIVRDKDRLTIVNVTTPVGVIPESARYGWEEVEEDDGSIHEYLWVEALIWKRQEAYKKIKENRITDESMEINVDHGTTVDGRLYIDRFTFTAFCLLESAEPCYESACLEMFSVDEFKQRYAEMMADFKKQFSGVNFSIENDIDTNKNTDFSLEGGKEKLDKTDILKKFNLKEEDIDFDITNMSCSELESALFEKYGDPNAPASGSENKDPEPQTQFALTASQLREGIVDALCAEKYSDPCFGEIPRYCYYDHDPDKSEVYCYDVTDWKLYGFKYSMNGDNVVIDFVCKTKKKMSIVDFDEGSPDISLANTFSFVEDAIRSKDSEIFSLGEKVKEMESQIDTLKQYQFEHEKEKKLEELTCLFAKFPELSEIEAFKELKANCGDLELAEVESKCYEIKGRNASAVFSVGHKNSTKLPVEGISHDDEPYGGIFVQFPPSK